MELLKFLSPEGTLFLLASLILLIGPFFREKVSWPLVSLIGFLVSYLLLLMQAGTASPGDNPYASVVLGGTLSNLIRHFSLGAGIFLLFLFWDRDRFQPETVGLLMILAGGSSMVGMANDLTVLYLGLELVTIPSYILLYCHGDSNSAESTMKYFFLSILSSAFLLLGIAFLYGLTGTTNIAAISDALLLADPAKLFGADALAAHRLLLIPILGILAGLGFKISMVPFHFYAPDVYQGAGYRMSAVLATMPKIAGFAGLIRIFAFALDHGGPAPTDFARDNIPVLFWILAFISITLGNLLALLQRNIRRIMAYSSIAHTGYILAAFAVASKAAPDSAFTGLSAAMFYLIVYFFSTFGIFAILHYLEQGRKPIRDWDDLAGTSKDNPVLAVALAIFLFSLTGIPLTGGFLAKFAIVYCCANVPFTLDDPVSWESHYLFILLALVIVLNAAVAAWYYLKLISGIFLKPVIWLEDKSYSFKPVLIPILASLLITVVLGIYPSLLLKPKAYQELIEKRPIAQGAGIHGPFQLADGKQ